MKKRLILLLTTLLLLCGVMGCTSQAEQNEYKESINFTSADRIDGLCGEHFTVITRWVGYREYSIVYANDTKVKYFIIESSNSSEITPLYNADGSLQIYEGE